MKSIEAKTIFSINSESNTVYYNRYETKVIVELSANELSIICGLAEEQIRHGDENLEFLKEVFELYNDLDDAFGMIETQKPAAQILAEAERDRRAKKKKQDEEKI